MKRSTSYSIDPEAQGKTLSHEAIATAVKQAEMARARLESAIKAREEEEKKERAKQSLEIQKEKIFDAMAKAKRMLYFCLSAANDLESMEMARGKTLKHLVEAQTKFSREDPGPIMKRILENLHYWTALTCLISIHYDKILFKIGLVELSKTSDVCENEAHFAEVLQAVEHLLTLKDGDLINQQCEAVRNLALLALADTVQLIITANGGVRTESPREHSHAASSSSSSTQTPRC